MGAGEVVGDGQLIHELVNDVVNDMVSWWLMINGESPGMRETMVETDTFSGLSSFFCWFEHDEQHVFDHSSRGWKILGEDLKELPKLWTAGWPLQLGGWVQLEIVIQIPTWDSLIGYAMLHLILFGIMFD